MKLTVLLEHLGGFALAVYPYSLLGAPWWWFAALFLAPDIGMAGYLAGPKVGALTYNLLHHLAVAVVVFVVGSLAGVLEMQVAGSVMMGHLFFDRALGFGLKYADGFKHTHLGTLK
ncbi:MAG TPA: DUF4260 domain-containing protein [Fimbriimonadaceae bacterium]|nr:DUF4260 domain-containing protein [Fimbriimonadaceae bacterium]